MLLPFVPVIAAIGACASRANSSMSPMIGTPRIAALIRNGSRSDTPGDAIDLRRAVEQRFIETAEAHFGFGRELLQRRATPAAPRGCRSPRSSTPRACR